MSNTGRGYALPVGVAPRHIIPGVRVTRHADAAPGERPSPRPSAQQWAEAIGAFDPAKAVLLKADGPTRVWRAALLGQDVVIKCWELGSRPGRVKVLFRGGRGDRHWRGAEWLLAHGVRTAQPLALAIQDGGAVRHTPRSDRGSSPGRSWPRQWLVMRALDGPTVLELLADAELPVRRQHTLAAELGRQVDRITQQGRYNRDHKPSNLIVEHLDENEARVAIIDCVAINRCSRGNGLAGLRMLSSLITEPIGCGVRPRRAVMMRALRAFVGVGPRNAVVRYWWERISTHVAAKGDPRPTVDPLLNRLERE